MKFVRIPLLARLLAVAPLAFALGLRAQSAATATPTPTPTPANGVVSLDPYHVNDVRPEAFTGTGNIDLPRTIDDIQPYTIYTSAQIEKSGATDIQDFFQRLVPMDTNHSPESSMYNTSGNHSNINLGGFGQNSGGVSGGTVGTLILLDGLPLPAFMYVNTTSQGDVNGIPLAAIDHIEVLTASASAIYGASAAGGVVNIVTKHDYNGGQLRFNYANTFDTDAPTKDVSLTFGKAFEGGKSHILITANYQTEKPVFAQDRLDLVNPYINRYWSLYPFGELASLGIISSTTGLYTATSGAMLSQPIITSTTLTPLFAGNPATTVQVPVGYVNPTVSGLAALQSNVGNYNLAHPNNGYYRLPIGLKFPENQGPTEKSFNTLLRRQMTPWLEAFAQVGTTTNFSYEPADPFTLTVTVPATAPGNPFGQAVRVTGSMNSDLGPELVNLVGHSVTAGVNLTLPRGWKGESSYAWSSSHYGLYSLQPNATAITAAVTNGTLNVFTDLAAHPFDAQQYDEPLEVTQNSTSNTLQAKLAGPLMKLWAGTPSLAIGAAHQQSGNAGGKNFALFYSDATVPNVATNATVTQVTTYTGQRSSDDDVYSELTTPLISRANQIFGVKSLEVQLSGRIDRYNANTTSPASSSVTTQVGGAVVLSPLLLNGSPVPFQSNPVTHFESRNWEAGFKYNPVESLAFRWSYGTGFSPPTYTQLLSPISSGAQTQPIAGAYPGVPTTAPWAYATITDPALNASYSVPVRSGGNPALTPETFRSNTWGVIYEPASVKGLRVALDYSKQVKYNAIVAPTAALLLANPLSFPDRITRGTPNPGAPVGPVTLLDTTYLNAPESISSSYNIAATYAFAFANTGTWTFSANAFLWQHFKVQSVLNGPFLEQLSNANASGAANPLQGSGSATGSAVARTKGNVSLDWTKGHISAGWLVRYTGAYTEGFSDGLTGASPYVTGTFGGWVRDQTYHDVYVSYKFGQSDRPGSHWMRPWENTKLQVGVQNVFNRLPPYDAADSYNSDYSTYGDIRLRTYNLVVSKDF
jgi:iron complex outermembrane receptor protein